jgi:energy-coupling factor transport system permease protein
MIANFVYIDKPTIIHRLDPRTKILLVLCVAFTAGSLRDIRALTALLILSFIYYSLARLPWHATKRAWTFILFFIVIMVGINSLFLGTGTVGEDTTPVLLSLPIGITITWSMLIQSIGVMFRMLSSVLVALPFTFTIKPTDFGVAFRGLGLPDKVAFSIDLAIRLVPTYAADFQSTIDAQRARGFEVDKVKGGFINRLRKVAPLVIPVTMNAMLSGEDITNALDMRGFGRKPRTWIRRTKLKPIDIALISFGVILLLSGIIWGLLGGNQPWTPPYPF